MKSSILILITMLLFVACDQFSKTGSIKDAETEFIKEVQYMAEKEALSNEISYYKAPVISIRRKVRDLTGRDAIHECNLIIEDNEESLNDLRAGRRSVVRTRNVSSEKKYAVDHPDDVVGAEYYFEGTFTHWNNGYNVEKAKVLYINGSWIVIRRY